MVIHVVRFSRGAGVVVEVLGGHRPALWVSDLYGTQQGHAEDWQICLAHQLRDCTFAIEAGDAVFAPRMKELMLRAVVLARRIRDLSPSTRREYRRRLEHALDAVIALAPTHRDGQRLRRQYGKVRGHLFTFLDHPEVPADNNGSERELRPTATYRKVTGGFRSDWGADLFAGLRSIIDIALNFARIQRYLDELGSTLNPASTAFDLGVIATGCAIDYISRRFPESEGIVSHPRVQSYYARLNERPSVTLTEPS